ncbi:MAG: Helix-turn-helix domain, partial [Mycobacterium sp.]|nr:Helix-turn-helix domain [Mycobacterium sp.]
MDATILLVSFLIFFVVIGGIVFAARAADARAAARAADARAAARAADARAAAARDQAAWAENAPARDEAHENRASISRVETIDADDDAPAQSYDDAAAQFYDKVPKQFLYSKQQAATALAMSTGRLNDLIRARKITAVQDGGRVKFTSADLQAYVDSLPSSGGSP